MPQYRYNQRHAFQIWTKRITVAAVFGIVIGLVVGYVHMSRPRPAGNIQPASQLTASSSTADVVAEIGGIVQLPSSETPVVVYVKDASKLANIAFFKPAKSGDIALLYQSVHKGFLYRPATRQLIASGAVTVN